MPLSGHGARLLRAPSATPSTFTEIAEIGDLTMPGLDHNEFAADTHNEHIDKWAMGILRRELMTVRLNFLPSDPTHDHLTGLLKAVSTHPSPLDGFRAIFPDSINTWTASGHVKSVTGITLPVDGLSTADVGIRFTGRMVINGVLIGI